MNNILTKLFEQIVETGGFPLAVWETIYMTFSSTFLAYCFGAVEDASGEAAQTYANIIAVKRGNEKSEKTTALLKALKTKKVSDFITKTYGGAVLPVFSV